MENKINCLRISKAPAGKNKRESDKPANENLSFNKVKNDLLIESEFYIHRLKVDDMIKQLYKLFPEKFGGSHGT